MKSTLMLSTIRTITSTTITNTATTTCARFLPLAGISTAVNRPSVGRGIAVASSSSKTWTKPFTHAPTTTVTSTHQTIARSLSTSSSPTTPASLVLSELKGNVLHITINRAELHNAFDEHVIAALTSAFTNINTSGPKAPRVVVLTGAGQSFSAGADLNWMKKMATYSEQQNHEDSLKLFDMVNAIRNCPLPVIARVTGACFGGGGGLVAACDFAFALNTAKFGFTETSLGLLPAVISRFVIDKIGRSAASRYFLTAERFSADVAKEIGLVSEVHNTEEELDRAIAAAALQLSRCGPNAIRLTKQLIETVSKLPDAPSTRDYTTRAIAAARVSAEGQDGLNSFFNKKPPSWAPAKPAK